LKNVGIDSISVSLNAESEVKYNELCRPIHKNAYRAVLNFIKGARKAGIGIRVTVVNLFKIDVDNCKMIAEKLDSEFHVRALYESKNNEIY